MHVLVGEKLGFAEKLQRPVLGIGHQIGSISVEGEFVGEHDIMSSDARCTERVRLVKMLIKSHEFHITRRWGKSELRLADSHDGILPSFVFKDAPAGDKPASIRGLVFPTPEKDPAFRISDD